MKRNWISVLLLLALTLALLPTAALAEDVNWIEIGQDDLEQLKTCGYYKLTANIDGLNGLDIGPTSAGATITLDLNGHTLTGAADSLYTLWINQNTTLTIMDSSSSGGGKVVSPNGTAVKVYTNAVFTLESGTISGGVVVGVGSISSDDTTAFTMEGGSITGDLTADGKTTINLNDGTVGGIWLKNNSTLFANGGTVTGPSTFYGTVRKNEDANGTVFNGVVVNPYDRDIPGTLNGGTVTGSGYTTPFLISTAEGLKWFRDYVNSAADGSPNPYVLRATLTADIDLENAEWTPIAPKTVTYNDTPYGYCGTFDGNGHTISGLNVSGDFDYAGLFGVVTGGTIKNLTVSGSVTSNSPAQVSAAGSIAGSAKTCTIEACANLCSVSGEVSVGGIAGQILGATVRDCYNVGTVASASNAGGIVGMTPSVSNNNTIVNCYNVGNVSANGYAGGILGNAGPVDVSNCYYLEGTAQKAIGMVDDSYTANRTAAEFADGTVRDLLKKGERGSNDDPWDSKCRYVPKAGKYLPVFKYQDSYEAAPESSSGSRFSYSTISASAGSNGKISPTGDVNVRSDLGQTFVFTPDKGYRVADVLVNGKSVGALRSYTFATARSDQTIEVVFEKIPAFVDVPAGSYYEEAVNWALENWITEGTSDTRFSPDAPCTRAQAVTLLWRAAGCPAPHAYTTAFEDVTSGSYYYQAVLWAVENGIAQGTSETTFEPDALCTRAQIVTLLFRYKAANGMDAVTLAELLGGFADSAEIPAYSRSALNWAISANVLQGSGEKLLPNDPCTRAQIVTFLYRAMQ